LIIAIPCWEKGAGYLALPESYLLSEFLVPQLKHGSPPDYGAILGCSTVAVSHVLGSDSLLMLSLESGNSSHHHQVLLLPLRALLLRELHIPGLIFVHQQNLHQHDLLNFDSNV
jgi:hypothetical protein